MSTLTHSSACCISPFVLLPHEIHLSIVDRVGTNTRDLCSLRATCRAFDQWYIRKRLFTTTHITFSFDKPGEAKLVVIMKDMLKIVENVTVSEEYAYRRSGLSRNALDPAFETILSGFGKNKIRAFRWLCHEGLRTSLLFKLIWSQGQVLELFHVTSFANSRTAARIMNGLAGITSFAYCQMKPGMTRDVRNKLKALMHSNSTRLDDLSLHAEEPNEEGLGSDYYSFEGLIGPFRFGTDLPPVPLYSAKFL